MIKASDGFKKALVATVSTVVLMGASFKASAEELFSGSAWSGPTGTLTIDRGDVVFCPKGAATCFRIQSKSMDNQPTALLMRADGSLFQPDEQSGKATLTCPQGQTSAWARQPSSTLSNLNKDAQNGKLKVADFSDATMLSYAAKTSDGAYLLVTENRKAKDYYGSFRLFVAKGSEIKEYAVKNVSRLRDGGTTTIMTEGGPFYSPVASRREETTFNGQVVTPVSTEEVKAYVPLLPSMKDKSIPRQMPCGLASGQS